MTRPTLGICCQYVAPNATPSCHKPAGHLRDAASACSGDVQPSLRTVPAPAQEKAPVSKFYQTGTEIIGAFGGRSRKAAMGGKCASAFPKSVTPLCLPSVGAHGLAQACAARQQVGRDARPNSLQPAPTPLTCTHNQNQNPFSSSPLPCPSSPLSVPPSLSSGPLLFASWVLTPLPITTSCTGVGPGSPRGPCSSLPLFLLVPHARPQNLQPHTPCASLSLPSSLCSPVSPPLSLLLSPVI